MAPRRTAKPIDPPSDSESGSGSGSDAPESIPLAASKKQTQKRESERQEAETLRKQKEKERNRERDARLKARAERNREVKEVKGVKSKREKAPKKGKGKEKEEQSDEDEGVVDNGDEETAALQARMERAMQDAQGESADENSDDEGDEDEDGPTFADFNGTSSGIEEGSEDNEESEEDQEDGPTFPDWDGASSGIEDGSETDDIEGDDGEDGAHSLPSAKPPPGLFAKAIAKSQKLTPKTTPIAAPKLKNRAAASASYLPDELFAAAFASQAGGANANPKRKAEDTVNNRPPAKKRKNTDKPRDVVIGSRAICILPNTHSNSVTGAAPPPPPPPATLPSRKVKKFLNRTLSLKGGKQPTKAWERRPANIGVARRTNGPARNFVRNP